MPKEDWPQDEDGLRTIMRNWQAECGDCRQELVFIGQDIDFERLTAELDHCLLDDDEMRLGLEGWRRLSDPFESWSDAG
ncbi:putative metal chaperone YciC [compost metagenome]